jgi:Flp pilus assembly protein TadG
VEFAAVALLFFTLILALFELGRGLMSDYLLAKPPARPAGPA